MTSRYLREQLAEFDREEPEDGLGQVSGEDRALLTKMQRMLVESYESLSTDEYERIHAMFSSHRSVCEYFLDDYFARRLLDDVPRIVKRIMMFAPIIVTTSPKGSANVYLQEAVRSHVHGLHQGAVTLARAAVEQGLIERVPGAIENRWTLDELIDAAARFKILSPVHLQMATDVQHEGNRVLHREPCTANAAADVLTKARAVLEQLFR